MKERLQDLLNRKLWMSRSSELPLLRRFLLNTARVILLTAKRFVQNQCTVKASFLTFYTLFSIVPVIALIFGIGKGLGLTQLMTGKIRSMTSAYPEVGEKLITFANTMLDNTKGDLVAGIGVLLLLWSAIKLLSSLENILNGIWGIKSGRPLLRKITDYIAILVICPILLLSMASGMVFAANRAAGFVQALPLPEQAGTILRMANGLYPFLMLCIVFSFIFIVIPNTKVSLFAAIPAGVLTAVVFLTLQSVYIFAQYTTANLNAIYGSLAALPLFLIWLNLSWIVVLAGAQLTFAIQNVTEYEILPEDGMLSQQQRYIYSMEIMEMLCCSYIAEQGGVSEDKLSEDLKLPIRTVRKLLFDLANGKLVAEIAPDQTTGNHLYQPAIPVHAVTPARIIATLEDLGRYDSLIQPDNKYVIFLEKMRKQLADSDANKPLCSLNNGGEK